jgi:DNA-binding beta-propeller fold protein YncE
MTFTPEPVSGELPGSVVAASMSRGGIVRLRPTSNPSASIDCHVFAEGQQPWLDMYTWFLVTDIKSMAAAWDPSVISDEFTFTVSLSAALGASIRSLHISRSTGVDALVIAGTVLYHLRLRDPWCWRSSWQVVGFKDLTSWDNDPRAAVWDEFGVRIYWVGAQNNAVRQLTMSSRTHNLSEAVDAGLSMSHASQGTDPVGLGIAPNDQHLYVLCNSNNTVFQYTFATWGTLTGAAYASLSRDIGTLTGETSPTALAVAGRHVYVVGTVTDEIHYLEMSAAPSIATAALVDSSGDLEALDNALSGLAVATDGSKLFGIGNQNDIAIEWNLIPLVEDDDYAVEFIPREVKLARYLNAESEDGYGTVWGTFSKSFFAPNATTLVRLDYTWGAVSGEAADEALYDGGGFLLCAVVTNNGAIVRVESQGYYTDTPTPVAGPVQQMAVGQTAFFLDEGGTIPPFQLYAAVDGSGNFRAGIWDGGGPNWFEPMVNSPYRAAVTMDVLNVVKRGRLDA